MRPRERRVEALEQTDQLSLRVPDGNDLNRPARLPRRRITITVGRSGAERLAQGLTSRIRSPTTTWNYSNRALSGLVMRVNKGIVASTTSADRVRPPSMIT